MIISSYIVLSLILLPVIFADESGRNDQPSSADDPSLSLLQLLNDDSISSSELLEEIRKYLQYKQLLEEPPDTEKNDTDGNHAHADPDEGISSTGNTSHSSSPDVHQSLDDKNDEDATSEPKNTSTDNNLDGGPYEPRLEENNKDHDEASPSEVPQSLNDENDRAATPEPKNTYTENNLDEELHESRLEENDEGHSEASLPEVPESLDDKNDENATSEPKNTSTENNLGEEPHDSRLEDNEGHNETSPLEVPQSLDDKNDENATSEPKNTSTDNDLDEEPHESRLDKDNEGKNEASPSEVPQSLNVENDENATSEPKNTSTENNLSEVPSESRLDEDNEGHNESSPLEVPQSLNVEPKNSSTEKNLDEESHESRLEKNNEGHDEASPSDTNSPVDLRQESNDPEQSNYNNGIPNEQENRTILNNTPSSKEDPLQSTLQKPDEETDASTGPTDELQEENSNAKPEETLAREEINSSAEKRQVNDDLPSTNRGPENENQEMDEDTLSEFSTNEKIIDSNVSSEKTQAGVESAIPSNGSTEVQPSGQETDKDENKEKELEQPSIAEETDSLSSNTGPLNDTLQETKMESEPISDAGIDASKTELDKTDENSPRGTPFNDAQETDANGNSQSEMKDEPSIVEETDSPSFGTSPRNDTSQEPKIESEPISDAEIDALKTEQDRTDENSSRGTPFNDVQETDANGNLQSEMKDETEPNEDNDPEEFLTEKENDNPEIMDDSTFDNPLHYDFLEDPTDNEVDPKSELVSTDGHEDDKENPAKQSTTNDVASESEQLLSPNDLDDEMENAINNSTGSDDIPEISGQQDQKSETSPENFNHFPQSDDGNTTTRDITPESDNGPSLSENSRPNDDSTEEAAPGDALGQETDANNTGGNPNNLNSDNETPDNFSSPLNNGLINNNRPEDDTNSDPEQLMIKDEEDDADEDSDGFAPFDDGPLDEDHELENYDDGKGPTLHNSQEDEEDKKESRLEENDEGHSEASLPEVPESLNDKNDENATSEPISNHLPLENPSSYDDPQKNDEEPRLEILNDIGPDEKLDEKTDKTGDEGSGDSLIEKEESPEAQIYNDSSFNIPTKTDEDINLKSDDLNIPKVETVENFEEPKKESNNGSRSPTNSNLPERIPQETDNISTPEDLDDMSPTSDEVTLERQYQNLFGRGYDGFDNLPRDILQENNEETDDQGEVMQNRSVGDSADENDSKEEPGLWIKNKLCDSEREDEIANKTEIEINSNNATTVSVPSNCNNKGEPKTPDTVPTASQDLLDKYRPAIEELYQNSLSSNSPRDYFSTLPYEFPTSSETANNDYNSNGSLLSDEVPETNSQFPQPRLQLQFTRVIPLNTEGSGLGNIENPPSVAEAAGNEKPLTYYLPTSLSKDGDNNENLLKPNDINDMSAPQILPTINEIKQANEGINNTGNPTTTPLATILPGLSTDADGNKNYSNPDPIGDMLLQKSPGIILPNEMNDIQRAEEAPSNYYPVTLPVVTPPTSYGTANNIENLLNPNNIRNALPQEAPKINIISRILPTTINDIKRAEETPFSYNPVTLPVVTQAEPMGKANNIRNLLNPNNIRTILPQAAPQMNFISKVLPTEINDNKRAGETPLNYNPVTLPVVTQPESTGNANSIQNLLNPNNIRTILPQGAPKMNILSKILPTKINDIERAEETPFNYNPATLPSVMTQPESIGNADNINNLLNPNNIRTILPQGAPRMNIISKVLPTKINDIKRAEETPFNYYPTSLPVVTQPESTGNANNIQNLLDPNNIRTILPQGAPKMNIVSQVLPIKDPNIISSPQNTPQEIPIKEAVAAKILEPQVLNSDKQSPTVEYYNPEYMATKSPCDPNLPNCNIEYPQIRTPEKISETLLNNNLLQNNLPTSVLTNLETLQPKNDVPQIITNNDQKNLSNDNYLNDLPTSDNYDNLQQDIQEVGKEGETVEPEESSTGANSAYPTNENQGDNSILQSPAEPFVQLQYSRVIPTKTTTTPAPANNANVFLPFTNGVMPSGMFNNPNEYVTMPKQYSTGIGTQYSPNTNQLPVPYNYFQPQYGASTIQPQQYPPIYHSMSVSFYPTAEQTNSDNKNTYPKRRAHVRSSTISMLGDHPFWSMVKKVAGMGIRGTGSLLSGVGKVSETGFDAAKDTFDTVKSLPVMKNVISPVKRFTENGLDVTDQTLTGSLLDFGSFLNDHEQPTQQRALHPDRYSHDRYRYPQYPVTESVTYNDESGDSDEEDRPYSKPVKNVRSYVLNRNNGDQYSYGRSLYPYSFSNARKWK